jgi:aspartate/methionine/tyrosine aminotransferase
LIYASHAELTNQQIALQKHFKAKRDHVLKRLKAMGLEVSLPPDSTFYIWLNLAELPAPLNSGLVRPFLSSFTSSSNEVHVDIL